MQPQGSGASMPRPCRDMVDRTSTEHAPWHLIEANDKYFARIKVLRTVVDAIEQAVSRAKLLARHHGACRGFAVRPNPGIRTEDFHQEQDHGGEHDGAERAKAQDADQVFAENEPSWSIATSPIQTIAGVRIRKAEQ